MSDFVLNPALLTSNMKMVDLSEFRLYQNWSLIVKKVLSFQTYTLSKHWEIYRSFSQLQTNYFDGNLVILRPITKIKISLYFS